MKKTNKKSESGLALPAAVWATLILFLMTASILNLTLNQGRQVSLEADLLQKELAVEAAFASAIKALHDDRTGDKKGVLSSPVLHTQGAYEVSVSISSEAGKVNLNLAEKDLIAALFVEAELSRAKSDTLAENIVDFRVGKRPFRTLGEVLKIRGMEPTLFEEIQGDLTLYSGRPGIKPEYASPRLLKSLAAMGEDFTPSTPSVLKPAEFETGTTWRLVATVTAQDGQSNTFTWIIRLTGDEKKPYLVHWIG